MRSRNTSIIVRKDNHKFAEIPIIVSRRKTPEKKRAGRVKKIDYFAVQAKGHRLLLTSGETLELVKGDKMKIMDVIPSDLSGVKVNFKGFVGDWKNNTGEDRGYMVNTATALMKRYSL